MLSQSAKIEYVRKRLQCGEFLKNVLVLMAGTSVASIIPILVSPVIARLFDPEDFGVLTIYSSILSVVTVIVNGRFEQAVMIPEEDEDALNVMALSLAIAFLVSLLVFVVATVCKREGIPIPGDGKVTGWIYLVTLNAFATGVLQTLTVWSIRKKQYKRLSENKIYSATVSSSAKLAGGVLKTGSGGLIVGELIGLITSTALLASQIWKEIGAKKSAVTLSRMRELATRYRDFPRYSVPADTINVVANIMPVFLFSHYFGAQVVGFYSFSQRVIGLPLTLIASSVLNVFKQRASYDYVTTGDCRRIYLKTLVSLLLLSALPFVVLLLSAPTLFEFVFGTKWRRAGDYAQFLSVLFLFRFVASPLSYVMYIAEKQRYNLIWQLCLFVLTGCSILVGVHFKDERISLLGFSLSYALMYALSLYLSYRFTKRVRT